MNLLREMRMRAAYRPALARRTTPSAARTSDGLADCALDQGLVFDDRNRFVRAVRAAARDHHRELVLHAHFGERHRRRGAKLDASSLPGGVGPRLGATRL